MIGMRLAYNQISMMKVQPLRAIMGPKKEVEFMGVRNSIFSRMERNSDLVRYSQYTYFSSLMFKLLHMSSDDN